MRNPERIEVICNLMKEVWKKDPDMRFIQLVEAIKSRYSIQNDYEGRRKYYSKDNNVEFEHYIYDLFHLEDEVLEEFLRSYLEQIEIDT